VGDVLGDLKAAAAYTRKVVASGKRVEPAPEAASPGVELLELPQVGEGASPQQAGTAAASAEGNERAGQGVAESRESASGEAGSGGARAGQIPHILYTR